MREKIFKDIILSMKKQEKEKLIVLRMVKGAIQLEEINKKRELTDNEVVAVISKQIKTRKESINEFEKGNRIDLIEKTTQEINILNEYMPQQLTEQEIEAVVVEAFNEINPQSNSDMGKIMKLVTPKLMGKADMSIVSKIVKEKINNL